MLLRMSFLLAAILFHTGCVKLIVGGGYALRHEATSPVGKEARYEMEPVQFDRAWVDGKREPEFLASVPYAPKYVDVKGEAARAYLEGLTEVVPSEPGAPWLVRTAVLQVETDETTGLNDAPSNSFIVEASVVERASGRLVERFVYGGEGLRTGYSFALDARVAGKGVGMVLSTGRFADDDLRVDFQPILRAGHDQFVGTGCVAFSAVDASATEVHGKSEEAGQERMHISAAKESFEKAFRARVGLPIVAPAELGRCNGVLVDVAMTDVFENAPGQQMKDLNKRYENAGPGLAPLKGMEMALSKSPYRTVFVAHVRRPQGKDPIATLMIDKMAYVPSLASAVVGFQTAGTSAGARVAFALASLVAP